MISIVIPAYNEEKRILKVLSSIARAFSDSDHEVVVVSNGSRDKTVSILREFSGHNKNVRYMDFRRPLGKGGAILRGLEEAKGDILGFVDADDAFDITEIKGMIGLLNAGYSCVIASKWKGKGFFAVDEPFTRKILSRGWNMMTRLLLDLRFHDTQAGAKFFRKDSYEKIGKDFISRGFAFDIELLLRLKKAGGGIREEHISNTHVHGSTFRLRHSLSMLSDLIRIFTRLR